MFKKVVFIVVVSGLLLTVFYWKEIRKKTQTITAQKRVETFMSGSLQEGDIIFQTSGSNQSKAIQLATKSRYSHMGILYKQGEQWGVYEAVQPVKLTALKEWIQRGEQGHYVIKRLKNAKRILTPETLSKMKMAGTKYKGKDYDIYFEWSDEKIYCSELVWKIYKEGAGIELGKLEKLRDFDLSSTIVRQKLKERYGETLPLNEEVISPAAIFDSKQLETIGSD
ncbi:YiiX family permuted papain-like enzyme [Rapidithrix thailandica]|uniref:YiiX family permuted papain-like enzyme n=1 Tax=Rapidithrix thailandica TaxID=413964 RepID=A0AAW9SBJ1_9BACT